jgi:hypothetical protein
MPNKRYQDMLDEGERQREARHREALGLIRSHRPGRPIRRVSGHGQGQGRGPVLLSSIGLDHRHSLRRLRNGQVVNRIGLATQPNLVGLYASNR